MTQETAAARSAALLRQLDESRQRTGPAVSTIHERMTQGDPAALAVYDDFQNDLIGPDPLLEGAHDWPAWTPATATLSPARPLTGWRMWAVVDTDDGPRLCAPFLTAVYQATPDIPGVTWQPGRNVNSTYGCKVRRGRHPLVECRCGIRVVQSLTVLRAFATNQAPRIGPLVAYAEVVVWGKVAPFAPDDDWRYTLRAEFAQIAGPLHLAPTHAMHADALAEHYGIEVTP